MNKRYLRSRSCHFAGRLTTGWWEMVIVIPGTDSLYGKAATDLRWSNDGLIGGAVEGFKITISFLNAQ